MNVIQQKVNNCHDDIFILLQMILINKALEKQRQAKINDKNRRFGVFMTPLSRRSKITE